MSNVNLMLYPLTQENRYIYDYGDLLCDFNIVYTVTDDFLHNTNYNSFEEGIQRSDVEAVMILPVKFENIYKVVSYVVAALERGKNVFSLVDFPDDAVKEFQQICSKQNVNYTLLTEYACSCKEVINRDIWNIETPIVTIAAISENSGLIDLELSIRKYFQNSDYKISQIGSFEYCSLFGMNPFPKYMNDDSSVTITDRTLLFNHYIKEIEMREQPDLIIISLPSALLPYNNKFHFGFGNLSFIASNAFSSDYTVMSLLAGKYSDNFLIEMGNLLEYRFNLRPDAWVMSNVFANYSEAIDENLIRYYSCESGEVDKMISESGKGIINSLDPVAMKSLYDNIVEVLSENVIY